MRNKEEKEVVFSITDVKQSPMAIFESAKTQKKGVYIYNRNKVAGVMLTAEQYESLTKKESTEQDHKLRLTQLNQVIRQKIAFGSLISTKNLDDHLASLGFRRKEKNVEDYPEILSELNETGKIEYQMQKKEDRTNIFAEVIGEQSNQAHLPEKIIVKKIHLKIDS